MYTPVCIHIYMHNNLLVNSHTNLHIYIQPVQLCVCVNVCLRVCIYFPGYGPNMHGYTMFIHTRISVYMQEPSISGQHKM